MFFLFILCLHVLPVLPYIRFFFFYASYMGYSVVFTKRVVESFVHLPSVKPTIRIERVMPYHLSYGPMTDKVTNSHHATCLVYILCAKVVPEVLNVERQ